MITVVLSILLFVIFTVLGFVHFNWVIGGKWGFEKALPTKENGERVLNPKKFDSAIVGFGLILFGLFYLLKSGLINFQVPRWIITYGHWIIPVIFILRAIEDFKSNSKWSNKMEVLLLGLFNSNFKEKICRY